MTGEKTQRPKLAQEMLPKLKEEEGEGERGGEEVVVVIKIKLG